MKNIKLLLLAVAVFPALAFAHAGDHSVYGWISGLLHPLLGVDHLLAMIAAGCWCSQQQTVDRRWLAAAFVVVLAAGIAVGAGFTGTTFESGIIATLVVLGALVACSTKLGMVPGVVVLGLVGAVHGFVHGAELNAGVSGSLSFVLGLLVSSLVVFALSASIAGPAQARGRALTARVVGAAIMTFGVVAIF